MGNQRIQNVDHKCRRFRYNHYLSAKQSSVGIQIHEYGYCRLQTRKVFMLHPQKKRWGLDPATVTLSPMKMSESPMIIF